MTVLVLIQIEQSFSKENGGSENTQLSVGMMNIEGIS